MYTVFLVTALVFIFQLTIIFWGQRWKKGDVLNKVTDSFSSSLVPGILLGFYAAFIFGIGIGTEESPSTETPLLAIKEVRLQEGSYFLGIGRTREVLHYQYYTKQLDVLDVKTVNPKEDTVLITETDTHAPAVKITRYVTPNQKRDWTIQFSERVKYEFYVPKNSTQETFKLG